MHLNVKSEQCILQEYNTALLTFRMSYLLVN